MWDFFQTVRHRHSIRRYQADMPVEPEKLHAILETAVTAPSAGDLQSYRIICVKDAALRTRLAEASNGQQFIAEAPVCLVFCSDAQRSAEQYGERGRELFSIQDATIVAAYAQLAVVAAGMGSTWVGMFDEQAVADTLSLEPGLRPLALLCVGYPAELPESSQRRRLDEVVTYR
ncbi:nitroreductase family protein [Ectothiorhodospira lacustris]|uniref:nitroreductase family protein n=1 Tax=Ectothiorhodospira lacustris TaxID=2899127 RepID=UPI001EE92C53|nr:nitroreductase family protein [Ectothiorhodospira lacustris]MCG5501012.1 nitroreductase family protein [Ectothiorhodospira lacustris]MCG5510564.1 nitroreductase family protein [Ectothiorhodospira lacustris]MCG5521256.1 nitroreductase family protein [Ectothiorhodospira lacustris]